MRALARMLGRAPSTVSRELARNGERTAQGRGYTTAVAKRRAGRRHAGRAVRPRTQRRLRRAVARKLALEWSPSRSAAGLCGATPTTSYVGVHRDHLPQPLHPSPRRAKQELQRHLRRGRSERRPARASPGPGAAARSSTPSRSASGRRRRADRAVPGHWEGDLLAGAGQPYVATLVERRSRYLCW